MIIVSFYFTGSPTFTQRRVGYRGKIFYIYKIRTFLISKDSQHNKEYYFGKIFRKYGLDELPQLYNILRNEMSLIGPRPLMISENKRMSLVNKKNAILRSKVKPGITGLSQVNGNTDLTRKKKMYFDIKYIETINFTNDLYIVYKTIVIVLCGKKK